MAIRSRIEHHPTAAFLILAFALSWAVKLPLAGMAAGWVPPAVPFAIHYLASFGPLLAALIVTLVVEGRGGVAQLLGRLRRWRFGAGWWLVCAGLPVALFALAALASALADGPGVDLARLGEVDYLPDLGAAGALLLWLLTFGLGEEVGWRGFLLPRLQRRHGPLAASLLLSIPWALWHLPAFLYRDTYVAMGLAAGLPLLWLSLLAASVVFTWIWNGTGGSLLAVIVFHALFDYLSVSPAGAATTPAVMSAGVMLVAALVALQRAVAGRRLPGAGAGVERRVQ